MSHPADPGARTAHAHPAYAHPAYAHPAHARPVAVRTASRRSAVRTIAQALAACAIGLAAADPALAQVGLQRLSIDLPTVSGGSARTPVLLWYPTERAATPQRFGPFEVAVAPGAPPSPGAHPVVVVSHGTGGHELGHAWLAQGLAQSGYLVVTLRHPGDNHEDRSAIARADYFAERPRQVSRVLDHVLADPQWARLADTARIAAVGHSAGGHTVLALAGVPVARAQFLAHCGAQGEGLVHDPVLCGLGGFSASRPATPHAEAEAPLQLRDARIRAVVADAPMARALWLPAADAAGAALPPMLLQYSQRDEVLVPRFHGQALCAALPQATCVADQEAGHMALFHPGTGPLGRPGNDPAADPPGFDRRAWQARSFERVKAFLDRALGPAGSPRS